jgi:hypothetical protein
MMSVASQQVIQTTCNACIMQPCCTLTPTTCTEHRSCAMHLTMRACALHRGTCVHAGDMACIAMCPALSSLTCYSCTFGGAAAALHELSAASQLRALALRPIPAGAIASLPSLSQQLTDLDISWAGRQLPEGFGTSLGALTKLQVRAPSTALALRHPRTRRQA